MECVYRPGRVLSVTERLDERMKYFRANRKSMGYKREFLRDNLPKPKRNKILGGNGG